MLKATGVSKYYNNNPIFQNVCLNLEKGERLALTGSSGVGKTSLIYILAGLDRDYSGEISRKTENVRVVFQDCGLFPHKTVKENILYLLSNTEYDSAVYKHWLEVCGLMQCEQMYPYQLSRGMKQKVAIIRAFLSDPELLFLDEPFSGLDKTSIDKIVDCLAENYADATMLIASHTKLNYSLCTRLFELQGV